MALALSDWLLAVVGFWGIWRLRYSRPLATRWLAWLGVLLLSAAAVLGGLRYMGNDDLAEWHTRVSDVATVLGLPLMMLALAALSLAQAGKLRGWLLIGLLVLLGGSALVADRQLAGAVSLGLLLLAVFPRPRRISGPLAIGCGLLLIGLWRQFEAVDITQRLIVMHLALAGLLVVWLREMGRVMPMPVEEEQQ